MRKPAAKTLGLMKIRWPAWIGLLLLLSNPAFHGDAAAQADLPPESLWHATSEDGEVLVNLYFFYSETCPHCARAVSFLPGLIEPRPWLRLGALNVNESQENRELYDDAGTWRRAVD